MINNRKILSFYAFSICSIMLFFPFSAFADYIHCARSTVGLLSTIRDCMNLQIDNMADTWLTSVVTAMGELVAALCVFAIMLYGIRLGTGSIYGVASETMFLMLKLMFIIAIALNAPILIEFRKNISDASEIIGGMVISNFSKDIGCGAAATSSGGIFAAFDCTVGQLFGIRNGVKFPNAVGLGLIVAGLLMTQYGLLIILLVISVFSSLFAAVLYSLMLYVRSMLCILFLAGIAPIVVPLMLFKPVAHLFDKWWKLFVFYSLMPIVLTAFIAMMLSTLSVTAKKLNAMYADAAGVISDDNGKAQTVFVQSGGGELSADQIAKLQEKGLVRKLSSGEVYILTGNQAAINSIETTTGDSAESNSGSFVGLMKQTFDTVTNAATGAVEAIKDTVTDAAGNVVQVWKSTAAVADAFTADWAANGYAAAFSNLTDKGLAAIKDYAYRKLQAMIGWPFLDWKEGKVLSFITLLLGTMFTLWLMAAFLKVLPDQLMQMVASGNIARLPGRGSREVNGIADVIKKPIANIASMPRDVLATKQR